MLDHRWRVPLLQEAFESFLAAIFPSACGLCGRELVEIRGLGVCDECWQQVEQWRGPACETCGLPFASALSEEAASSLCGHCRRQDYEFDFARSYGLYAGNLRHLILQLKFNRRERLGRRLGEKLARLWPTVEAAAPGQELLLVPVPLHRRRERARGFNQAALLTEGLHEVLTRRSKHGILRPQMRCLLRTRATVPQTGLGFQARQENVRGAFEVASPKVFRDRVTILVDDVMTSGATLSACAKALKQAGASRVLALTLARATPQFPDTHVPSAPAT